MKRFLVPAVLVAATGAAQAGPIRLTNSFSPHPLVVPYVEVDYDDVRVYDLGYKKCDPGSGAFTTAQPTFTFELAEPMPDLYVRFENRDGGDSGQPAVIAVPDGTYFCSEKSGVWAKDWKRGTYKVFLYGSSIGGGAALKFEIPSRSTRDVERALAALPVIPVGAGPTNPEWRELAATASAAAQDAGIGGCSKRRVMPLAKLDVKRASTWFFDVEGADETFVVTPDGKCGDPRDVNLEAGTHVLWTAVKHDGTGPAKYALEIDDRKAPLVFPAAEQKPVGALDEAMTIAGKVRPTEKLATRSRCRGMARQPDFYLTSDRPLQDVAISLLWGREPQRLHVFGPIDDPKAWIRCDDDRESAWKFDVFEGSYAVWIGPGAQAPAAVGSDYHVLVRRTEVAVDPMTALAPIPTQLSLDERAFANHYPFFDKDHLADLGAAFTRAPDQLFVYVRTPTKGEDVIEPGEPLLVSWSNKTTTAVWRWNGKHASVDTRLVTTERPATIVLPTKVALDPEKGSGIRDGGPEDDKPNAAYQKVSDKYNDCFYRYMSKHDPTWGHSHQLYKISGSGKITNVGDEAAKRAGKKCGESKVDAAKTKLEQQLFKNRTARWEKHLASIRTRFGL
jgi:hypothetical protein